jgi:hypothetical protein
MFSDVCVGLFCATSLGKEPELLLLDPVFHFAPRTVHLVIDRPRVAPQAGDDEMRVGNIIAFTLELLGNLPAHIRLRVVRADSGFCVASWLGLLEGQRLKYIVVARLLKPLQRLCRKEVIWMPNGVPDTEVAEVWHEEAVWGRACRLILVRHKGSEKKRPGGKRLLEVEGYTFQALATNLPGSVPPIALWRDYNGRAGCEGVRGCHVLQPGFLATASFIVENVIQNFATGLSINGSGAANAGRTSPRAAPRHSVAARPSAVRTIETALARIKPHLLIAARGTFFPNPSRAMLKLRARGPTNTRSFPWPHPHFNTRNPSHSGRTPPNTSSSPRTTSASRSSTARTC